jgi:apolipoprotein D and lipocalin family protein
LLKRIGLIVFVVGTTWAAKPADGRPPLEVVPSVDLNRYAGKWYEIARLPNRFQRECASDITATYTLRPDGKITVLNECLKADGSRKSAKGTARLADAKGPNTKLRVTFFWPFSGNYWIIDLDPEYRWAVVGEPGRDYLWILAREPRLDTELYKQIVERAEQRGFDTGKLLKTHQAP